MKEWGKLGLFILAFVIAGVYPPEVIPDIAVIGPGLALLREYVRLHILTCLLPALFIAGTIAVFVRKEALLKLLGPQSPKLIAYPVAGLSGGILAVCSCTILPLFTGIHKRGAGIGPAIVFLFTGPAINITAITLTGTVFGWDFALVRLSAAFVIAVVSGLIMSRLFQDHHGRDEQTEFVAGSQETSSYSALLVGGLLALQFGILIVFDIDLPLSAQLGLTSMFLVGIAGILFFQVERDDALEWIGQTWLLTKTIVPFLLIGVFFAGALGSIAPEEVVTQLVGSNSVASGAITSVFGAFMYFATLTEIPIVQRLMELGMAKGPALTLFLTGTSVSIPSILVLLAIMGKKQTGVYILSIIVLSVIAGWIFGNL